MKKILTFKINSELYCFNVNTVVSIDQKSHVTQIPLAPYHVEGVINLRGQIIPVLDVRKLFKISEKTTKEQCYIFVETEAGRLGCLVDSVCDVIEIQEEDLVQTSEAVTANTANHFIESILKVNGQIIFTLSSQKLYESISSLDLEINPETIKGAA